MPVVKRRGKVGGYRVKGTTTKKRMTKEEAEKQEKAINIAKHKRRKSK